MVLTSCNINQPWNHKHFEFSILVGCVISLYGVGTTIMRFLRSLKFKYDFCSAYQKYYILRRLTGCRIVSEQDGREACKTLHAAGPSKVLLYSSFIFFHFNKNWLSDDTLSGHKASTWGLDFRFQCTSRENTNSWVQQDPASLSLSSFPSLFFNQWHLALCTAHKFSSTRQNFWALMAKQFSEDKGNGWLDGVLLTAVKLEWFQAWMEKLNLVASSITKIEYFKGLSS